MGATNEVRIKRYRIGRHGTRGLKIGLPGVWVSDLGLKPGDSLDLFRDTDDRLIIVKGPAGGAE